MTKRQPKPLQQTLWDIQKRWGQRALGLWHQTDNGDCIPTGFASLDGALRAGGIPRGQMTELVGVPTSGVTTLAHHIIAHTQNQNETAVYLDLSRTFDADYAARCGVKADRLLVVQPHHLLQALEIAHDIAKAAVPTVVVVDAITQPEGRTSMTIPIRRLHNALLKSRCAVLFLRASPLPRDVESCVHTRLRVQRLEWLQRQHDIRGYRVQITIAKDSGEVGDKQVTLEIVLDGGIEGGGV